ncbi:hypothetical protein [Flaviflexus massiliensis]|uniref:hypothetical protein n=1 Tax=Flaviflexus massiliensis TaxID=1522309 RepID=UPI0011C6F2BE|nr:hypothetical protein [Flaviflexus massiliensis]
MKVVSVHTPGSTLLTLEVRDDLSMIERRTATMSSGLSLAVASAGSEICLSSAGDIHDPATIVIDPPPEGIDIGTILAMGTGRFEVTDNENGRLWVRPTTSGVVQPGDVVRPIPAKLLKGVGMFPRVPDGLPDAWVGDGGRFTPGYESRAEELWKAISKLGFHPTFDWAGSEDGEAIVARDSEGHAQLIIDLEEPQQQRIIDSKLAEGILTEWIREEISSLPKGL